MGQGWANQVASQEAVSLWNMVLSWEHWSEGERHRHALWEPRGAWIYHEDLRLRGEMQPCSGSLGFPGSRDPIQKSSGQSLEPEMILSGRPCHLVEKSGTAA